MRTKGGLAEYPTVKLREEDLARAAREADAKVIAAEIEGQRSTLRPAPRQPSLSYPEIEVSLEDPPAGLDLEGITDSRPPVAAEPPRVDDGDSRPLDHHSDVRPTWRADDGPAPHAVPCVVVSKEDLFWFELEASSQVVLERIDGASTVEAIIADLGIPHDIALSILRELGSHGVIEFH